MISIADIATWIKTRVTDSDLSERIRM